MNLSGAMIKFAILIKFPKMDIFLITYDNRTLVNNQNNIHLTEKVLSYK